MVAAVVVVVAAVLVAQREARPARLVVQQELPVVLRAVRLVLQQGPPEMRPAPLAVRRETRPVV